MKLFNFLIICIFASLSLSLHGQWRTINPAPTNNNLNGLVFLDHDRGIAVGDNGTILKTGDGGQTWILMASLSNLDLNGIVNAGSGKLLICGDKGLVMATDYSLQPAVILHSGSAYDLKIMQFRDSLSGWCAGSMGIVLSTIDGGNHWSETVPDSILTITSISFPTDNTGYLCGNLIDSQTSVSARIFKTGDGGRTWTRIYETSSQLFAISFADSLFGSACGTSGSILRTADGGTTWIENILWNNGIDDILIENRQTGWCLLNTGNLFKTINGGESWTFITQIGNASRLYKSDQGYIAYGRGGAIYFSSNGSDPWIRQTSGAVNNLDHVIFADSDNGFILGDSILFSTRDGGDTWVDQPTSLGYVLAADFRSANIGVVATSNGVYYTENGGIRWNRSDLPYITGIYDFGFTSSGTLFLAGINYGHYFANSKFFRSSDNGKSWTETQIGDGHILTQLLFLKDKTGYAAGFGACFRTTDNGDTWVSKLIDIRFTARAMSFATLRTGMVSGTITEINGASYTRIYKTTDGGDSWTAVRSDTSMFGPELAGVYMTGTSTAYAAYTDGGIISTTDGGQTWTEDFRSNWISAIGGNEHAYAVGYYGTILTTNPRAGIFNARDSIPGESKSLLAYPNPFTGEINLEFTLESDNEASIRLFDFTGKTILDQSFEGRTGLNRYYIERGNLPPGLYLIMVTSGSFIASRKLVRLR